MDLKEDNLFNPISHWYYQHKYREIINCIRRYKVDFKIVSDVGAGSAVFSNQLSRDFPSANFNLIDINYSSERLMNSTTRMKYVRQIEPADVFLLNDVLEHIESPKVFIQEICSYGKNKDLIIITVPAFMQLWSGHDVFLKHYRRYTKKTLLQDLQAAPISVLEVKYLYQSLFIPTWIFRKLFGKKEQSQLSISNIAISIPVKIMLLLERKLRLRLPFGVSILLVAIINKE